MAKGRKRGRTGKYKHDNEVYHPKAVVCYCPKVCPDVMRAVLTYSDILTLSSSGLSSFNANVYRGNSLFDLDQSGLGSQPMGRDEWANFYRRYRVLGAKITFQPQVDAAGVVLRGGVTALTTSGGVSSVRDYEQQAYTVAKPLGNTGATGQNTISMYVSTDQIRGMPKGASRINADLSSLMTTNPVDQWFIHAWVVADDGATTWSASGVIKIEYYVELYDRETLSQS